LLVLGGRDAVRVSANVLSVTHWERIAGVTKHGGVSRR
jgi:hypothetical protein